MKWPSGARRNFRYTFSNVCKKGRYVIRDHASKEARQHGLSGSLDAALLPGTEYTQCRPGRTPDNQHLVAKSTDEAMGKLRALLPEKRRKDAVLAVEYVMTASPEWFAQATPEQEQAFFQLSLQWLADKYGADRIVTASIHRDEITPHLSAFVVPLTQDRRLSAKEFIGSRDKMRADQTAYAACVADLGLERGIEGSKATHQTIQQHYAAIQRGVAPKAVVSPKSVEPRVLEKATFFDKARGRGDLVESPEMIAGS